MRKIAVATASAPANKAATAIGLAGETSPSPRNSAEAQQTTIVSTRGGNGLASWRVIVIWVSLYLRARSQALPSSRRCRSVAGARLSK